MNPTFKRKLYILLYKLIDLQAFFTILKILAELVTMFVTITTCLARPSSSIDIPLRFNLKLNIKLKISIKINPTSSLSERNEGNSRGIKQKSK